MKILQINYLIKNGVFSISAEFESILDEIRTAVLSVSWPAGQEKFILYPEKQANGVMPIKKNCMEYLNQRGWILEKRMSIASRLKPGKLDAVKQLHDGRWAAVEWETGNISSSHRAINKMAIGLLDGVVACGFLIVPSREMYRFLTDRIGNFAEIEPYFPMWRNLKIEDGVLAVIEIEHDAVSKDVPQITKGTDGRVLR